MFIFCREVLEKNPHLFKENIRTECLQVLTAMKKSAHSYFLTPMHEALKVRKVQKV